MVRRRDIFGGLCAVVLLWFLTISRLIADFCTADVTTVFLYQGCINGGPVTVFTACLMEVVLGSWFLRKFFLPALFGKDNWAGFDSLKQQKLVGFLAQIVVRSACTVQLTTILFAAHGSELSLTSGLFAHHNNAKAAYNRLLHDGKVTTCAGMQRDDVAALRAWYLTKYHMAAVHIWELSFIPGLPLDAWLHHLFVIAVAAVASSPDTLSLKPEKQPFLDLIGFSLIFGAALNFMVKLCVVMYHFTAPAALRQARWMEASIAGALIILLVFYLILPCIAAVMHAREFGPAVLIFVIAIPVAFLVWVEVRLVIVKRSIARNARRKAAERAQAFAAESCLASEAEGPVEWSWISVGRVEAMDDASKEASF